MERDRRYGIGQLTLGDKLMLPSAVRVYAPSLAIRCSPGGVPNLKLALRSDRARPVSICRSINDRLSSVGAHAGQGSFAPVQRSSVMHGSSEQNDRAQTVHAASSKAVAPLGSNE
jgi:hypothetical protein